MTAQPPFAIYYDGDAYSTADRIMGRQSAGKAFIHGIARTWPNGTVHALVRRRQGARTLTAQLQADGFTGRVHPSALPDTRAARAAGTLYYPAPPGKDLAWARNLTDPAAFSLMGVTHTLASAGAMDMLADLILPPFQPWDALICTSCAAHALVSQLHDEMRTYWRESIGATRFVDVERPVIPLGVDAPAFASSPETRIAARAALGLRDDETVFLFAGRLAFHAKANPAPVYAALAQVARDTPVVLVEAGVFPGEHARQAYLDAQAALAPNVRFLWVDGQDATRYRQAWLGADVFVSLADNIQETFGLTPVEAMAAGLPVVVSDWNGYKDTVRDGIDGFRVPTTLAPAGAGEHLAARHALGVDSYDRYIGITSLATVVAPDALAQALHCLALDPTLRQRMGAAGRARAVAEFDWPVILHRYAELADHLGQIRARSAPAPARPWPQRADPFRRFAHYAGASMDDSWQVRAKTDAAARLPGLMALSLTDFALGPDTLPREALAAIVDRLGRGEAASVSSVLADTALPREAGLRAMMWLWKFDLVHLAPGPQSARTDAPEPRT